MGAVVFTRCKGEERERERERERKNHNGLEIMDSIVHHRHSRTYQNLVAKISLTSADLKIRL